MAFDVDAPQSGRGVLIALAVLALIVVAIFTSGIGPVLLGAVVIAVAAYLVYVIVGRLDDWLRHGKPLFRRRARKKQRQTHGGGDDGE